MAVEWKRSVIFHYDPFGARYIARSTYRFLTRGFVGRLERSLNWTKWMYTLNTLCKIPGAKPMHLSRTSMLSKWDIGE